jgi:hypothetical protein
MLSPERLMRLRLVPLRSARALADPRQAMRRAVRLVGAVCGGAAVRCTAKAGGACISRAATRPAEAAQWHTVTLHDGDAEFGCIDVHCTVSRWHDAAAFVEQVAAALALLLAVHAVPARALRGVWLASQRLHDLNNTVGAITLQIGVLQTLLQRGRTDEAAEFAERCGRESERLIELLARLRHR